MSELIIPIGTLITLGIALISGGIAYGKLDMKTAAAHRRIDEINTRLDKRDEKLDLKLETIDEKLEEIKMTLIRSTIVPPTPGGRS